MLVLSFPTMPDVDDDDEKVSEGDHRDEPSSRSPLSETNDGDSEDPEDGTKESDVEDLEGEGRDEVAGESKYASPPAALRTPRLSLLMPRLSFLSALPLSVNTGARLSDRCCREVDLRAAALIECLVLDALRNPLGRSSSSTGGES